MIQITDHVARRIARLATLYKNSASHKGVLAALAAQVQDVENAAWNVLALRSITTCTAAQLDLIGTLLSLPREGRTDAAYRIRLRAQVLVNSRSGEFATLLLVLRLLAPTSAVVSLTEYYPASLVASVDGAVLDDTEGIARVLRVAKAAGVALQLTYQDTATDADLLVFDDTAQAGSGLGLGDSSSSSVGGVLAGVT